MENNYLKCICCGNEINGFQSTPLLRELKTCRKCFRVEYYEGLIAEGLSIFNSLGADKQRLLRIYLTDKLLKKIETLEEENKILKEELLKAREYGFMYKQLCK